MRARGADASPREPPSRADRIRSDRGGSGSARYRPAPPATNPRAFARSPFVRAGGGCLPPRAPLPGGSDRIAVGGVGAVQARASGNEPARCRALTVVQVGLDDRGGAGGGARFSGLGLVSLRCDP